MKKRYKPKKPKDIWKVRESRCYYGWTVTFNGKELSHFDNKEDAIADMKYRIRNHITTLLDTRPL